MSLTLTDDLHTPAALNQVPVDGMAGTFLVRNRAREEQAAPPPAAPAAAPARPPVYADDVLARMSGARRAAVLLIALGVETAAKVLPILKDEEVEAVSIEIARVKNVPGEQVEAVLAEYRDLALAREYIGQGGPTFARQMLRAALGEDRAEEVLMKVEGAMEVSGFHLLQTVETPRLVEFFEGEHPQTTALILTQLNPRKAGELVSKLPPEIQGEVAYRIATMAAPAPEVLRDVEEIIRQQIGAVLAADSGPRGGVGKVAEILGTAGRSAERAVMEALKARAPELAAAVKGLMFVFDDLVHLDGRDLQRILMEVEARDLALALKAAPEELRGKVFENVSDRVAQGVREEIELMGNVRVADVDDAQSRVLQAAQDLEARGEITLVRAGQAR